MIKLNNQFNMTMNKLNPMVILDLIIENFVMTNEGFVEMYSLRSLNPGTAMSNPIRKGRSDWIPFTI